LPHRLIPKVMPESVISMTEWKTRILKRIVEGVPVPDETADEWSKRPASS
jgi:hypothetical protein